MYYSHMLSKITTKYPLMKVEVKTLHAGVVEESIDITILGQLPKRIMVSFVNNKCLTATENWTCLILKININLNLFSLYVDGIQIPSRPLQSNFLKDELLFVEAYHTLFSAIDIHFLNESNSINRDDYIPTVTLFPLIPDLSANGISWNTGAYD